MDLQKSLLALREYAHGHEISLLIGGGDAAFASKMDACIQQIIEDNNVGKKVNIPAHLLDYMDNIRGQLASAGLADSDIRAYTSSYGEFDDIIVLSVLALVFELDIGFSWAPGLVRSKCPDLEFDGDGLLVGPLGTVDFAGPRNLIPVEGKQPVDFSYGCQKTGIAYGNSYVIPFHYSIERYNLGLSDGFLRILSNFVAEHSSAILRVKISEDTLIDMSRFRDSMTRAYIRGPKSISPTKLQSDSFPENTSGVVTEHRWVEDGSRESLLSKWLFPIEGFQVLWSRNGSLKTFQAEEVVRPSNTSAREGAIVYNRYVHAIWDTTKGLFSHFDGGIRGYAEQTYSKRVASDIRIGRELSNSYVKLWRLDGEIPFENWATLLVKYFYGHNLAAEYLEHEF